MFMWSLDKRLPLTFKLTQVNIPDSYSEGDSV